MRLRTSILALLALAVAGCTGGSGSSTASGSPEDIKEQPRPPKVEGQLKVALVTPGPVSDSGWNALAYEGLTAIKDELGAEVNNQEAVGTQTKDALRSYAQKGYHLVIGHGYEYNEPMSEVAPDFPNTVFVSSSGGKMGINYGAFRFYLEQGFYLAGMMAAKMSKNQHVAMIGGDDVPSIRSTFLAFREGAQSVNANIEVTELFTGSGKDAALAKQATLQAIGKGADFIIHQANAAAQGVFDAAKEKGVYAFGANLNQNDNASGVVIASAVIVARPAFVDLANDVKNGNFDGGIFLRGMDIGAIDFIVNPAMKDKIPADVLAFIEETRGKITKGEITVPKADF